jgi:hypothetical protein
MDLPQDEAAYFKVIWNGRRFGEYSEEDLETIAEVFILAHNGKYLRPDRNGETRATSRSAHTCELFIMTMLIRPTPRTCPGCSQTHDH